MPWLLLSEVSVVHLFKFDEIILLESFAAALQKLLYYINVSRWGKHIVCPILAFGPMEEL